MEKREKTGGRVAGVPNRSTSEIREHIQFLVEDNLDLLNEDIKSLEPIDRIKIITQLAKFILPTLKAEEITAKEAPLNPTIIKFEFGDD